MKRLDRYLRAVRSAGRLGLGLLKLPHALIRGRDVRDVDLICVDIFETLVARTVPDDLVWAEGAIRCSELAAEHGCKPHSAPIALRRKVEDELSDSMISAGSDPEFSHERIFLEMLKRVGRDAAWTSAAAKDLASWELEREIAFTRSLTRIAEFMIECSKAGKRVVAVSDTRYSSAELATLLERRGIKGITSIYASADYGLSKFSGRLFDCVFQQEKTTPNRVLHIGDNYVTDGLAASERGLRVRLAPRTTGLSSAQLLPAAPADNRCTDASFALGYETIGPVLVAFVRLALEQARRDGVKRLAFVARDGDLPFRIACSLADSTALLGSGIPTLSYVHLSRRSIASATLFDNQDELADVDHLLKSIRDMHGSGSFLEDFRTYFELPQDFVSRQVTRLQLSLGNEEDLRRMLLDPVAVQELREIAVPMRQRLRQYLQQEALLCSGTALVDIGWRGTILAALRDEALARGLPSPRGYLLGLWGEDRIHADESVIGLLSDQRRGRGLLEGSAWHSAFLLEAVCRASHGMVYGYAESEDGTVRPLHVEKGRMRDAERRSERCQERIREGVLEYTRWFARSRPATVLDNAALRKAAQRRLHKLAFFPSPAQRMVGRQLVFTQPTDDQSAAPLIAASGHGLREWISGIRSPWKGAYFCETGGALGGTLYCFAEGVLSRLPRGTKSVARNLLFRNV